MTTEITAQPSSINFSGHETFPFRFSWLWKGIKAVNDNPKIFSSQESIIKFGVGKNMVNSIRYWCSTLGLVESIAPGHHVPTERGRKLFLDDGGLDPYLEKSGTLWWLHWILANNEERATTWYFTFNLLPRTEFSRGSLRDAIIHWISTIGYRRPAISSVERDIDCMIRTYWTPQRLDSEDSLSCPLTELNLLRGTHDRIRLLRGPQPSLPDPVFAAAVVEAYQWSPWQHTATMPVEYLLFNPKSPGRVFLLDDTSLIDRLYRLESLTDGAMTYDETAGLRQVLIHNRSLSSQTLLDRYYRRN
ncbi:DUF4007 family protein [Sulfobacillus thermosulfidooxidans]|uniref:DUF4007 family protein n=1 Tax=Sulfobacillus thermosulfidooxidans TaxID=28034 RepID=UPI0002DA3B46|nr:DUF4007 family protein [Sulfobacillus thermosulfidooxidans]